jgi:uncharacterized membrane protein
MAFLRGVLKILGVLMIAMGLLWIGQGLNIIRWPAESFMIGVPQWSWRGAGLAVLGAGVIWISRKR